MYIYITRYLNQEYRAKCLNKTSNVAVNFMGMPFKEVKVYICMCVQYMYVYVYMYMH